jgi:hypothetical protein
MRSSSGSSAIVTQYLPPENDTGSRSLPIGFSSPAMTRRDRVVGAGVGDEERAVLVDQRRDLDAVALRERQHHPGEASDHEQGDHGDHRRVSGGSRARAQGIGSFSFLLPVIAVSCAAGPTSDDVFEIERPSARVPPS